MKRAALWAALFLFPFAVRLGTALQGWPVVVVAGRIAGPRLAFLVLLLFGARAKRRLVGALVCFALEHHGAQPRLHRVELRSRDDVLVAVRQYPRNFFLRVLNALGRRRMRREHLGDRARAAPLVGLDALEER